MVIQRSIGSAIRVLKNSWADKVLEMERKGASREELMPLISGKRAGDAWIHGGDDAVFACGQVVGRTLETLSIKDLVSKIMSEAEETRQRVLGQGA